VNAKPQVSKKDIYRMTLCFRHGEYIPAFVAQYSVSVLRTHDVPQRRASAFWHVQINQNATA